MAQRILCEIIWAKWYSESGHNKKKAFYVKQSWGVDEATEEKSKERQNAPEKIREERKK